jgi:hypothetical protein
LAGLHVIFLIRRFSFVVAAERTVEIASTAAGFGIQSPSRRKPIDTGVALSKIIFELTWGMREVCPNGSSHLPELRAPAAVMMEEAE